MSEKVELYKEIHLDSWQDFVKKLLPGEEYHHLLNDCIWRGQRRKDGEKHEDKELRASYFRRKNSFEAVDIPEQPGKKTYVLKKDGYFGFCYKLSAHYDRFVNYQNVSGKIYINNDIPTKGYFSKTQELEYAKNYAAQYSNEISTLDVLWRREYDLRKWIWLQHYGVKTPLVDWTIFPFYALFFAYQGTGGFTKSREIFALNPRSLHMLWHSFKHCAGEKMKQYYTEILHPLLPCQFQEYAEIINADMSLIRIVREDVEKSVDNARIVRQGGLFTHTPGGYSVEEWLRRLERSIHFNDICDITESISGKAPMKVLYKFIIPETDNSREDCLIYLNSMNVNDAMIYPDFQGLANAVNTADGLPANKISAIRLY